MADQKGPVGGRSSPSDPGYFLSLSLENVRCFGPSQMLDLSDGTGKPARWTVILGVNGTGKTTILQSLVGFEAVLRDNPESDWPRFGDVPFAREGYKRGEKLEAKISIKIAASLTASARPILTATMNKADLGYSVHAK